MLSQEIIDDIEEFAEKLLAAQETEQKEKALNASHKLSDNLLPNELEYTGNDHNLQVYYNSQKSVGSLT